MIISVLSPDLNRIGIIDHYESLVHKKEFAGSGSFTLRVPFTQKIFSLLQEDNILMWCDTGKTKAVYIDSVIVNIDKTMYITASGKNLRGLLGRRIIWNNFAFSGTVEDFAYRCVNENAVAPTDITRIIPNLALASKTGCEQTITTETNNENIEDLLDALTSTYEIGFDILFSDNNGRALVFSAYEGADYRTTQKELPRVIISRERNNVVSEEYTRSSKSLKNTALISGYTAEETGERYEDSFTYGSGLARREMYIQGSAAIPKADENEGISEKQALETYVAELQTVMQTKLAEQIEVRSLDVEVAGAVASQLEPGDKVTAVEKDLDLILQTYISSITTYYEKGGKSYDVTIGNAVPDIYSKLKKGIK